MLARMPPPCCPPRWPSATALAAALALGCLAPHAPAQEPTLDAILQRAAELAGRGEAEAAAAQLREARRLALRIGDAREQRRQLAAIRTRLAKLDPVDRRLRPDLDRSVAHLLEAAEAYLECGWRETALPLLRAAELIEPGSAAALLAAAASTDAGAPAGDGPAGEAIGAFFRDAETYGDAWQIADGEVTSPALTDHSLMLVAKKPLAGDCRVGVEVMLGAAPGKAALVFGHDLDWEQQTFCFLEIMQTADVTHLRILEHDGGTGRMTTLAQQTLARTAVPRGGWLRLAVEVRGGEATGWLGTESVGPCRPAKAPLPGAVGFYLSSDSENRAPVRFRGWRVEAR